MLPQVYHLQKVSFSFGLTNLTYFVVAYHPDHARQVLANYLADLNKKYWFNNDLDIVLAACENSNVQFIATLVNNENIHACVLEL